MTYDDARLAALYDTDNPDGPDHDFFRRYVRESGARRIVDLGCGTGILTVTLTAPGRSVVGIDPAAAMLEVAQGRPGGEDVQWVQGTSDQIAPGSADLVLMTGNVAMHLIGDTWTRTLTDVAAGLTPGGRLLFDARNPDARAWRHWQDPGTERDTPVGRLRESATTGSPDPDGVVRMQFVNEFLDTGDRLDGELVLQFRSHAQIEADLRAAGLRPLNVWRDWNQTPFTGGADQHLMVVEAASPRR